MLHAFRPFKPLSARPSLLAACLALSLQAQAAPVQLQLPAQPLAVSLSQLAQQAKVQLLFDESLLRNVQAPALDGQYEAAEAIARLLASSRFAVVKVGNTYVVRPREDQLVTRTADENGIQLGALSIVGDGQQVTPETVGRSTLTQVDIDRHQPSNIPNLLTTLPGVSMGGSQEPGGQTINIWGMGDAEDVPLSVDGATKSGFERYSQGTIFIEPELIKRIEVEKGPHSVLTGNGGFGGTVRMETKDAPELLQEGRNTGAMVKYGYSSNDHQQIYSSALFGRTDDGRADALVYLTKRDGDDLKLAGTPPDRYGDYPINPKRLPNTAQDLDGGLFKLNLNLTDEQSLKLSYSRSRNERWTPFSSTGYPTPPLQSNIDKLGYEGALRRYLANRETIDTTWSTTYKYQPIENPLIDLEVRYSESDTKQTDERDASAFFQVSTGGRKMETEYKDRMLEVRNTSLVETGPLEHALTLGTQLRRHNRDTLMWMPGASYSKPAYNDGYFQPPFMPQGKTDTNSFYIEDAITLGDVTVTPSLRYDHVTNKSDGNDAPYYNKPALGHDYGDQTYSGWSPRLKVYWRATEQHALFADYSQTWRAPVIDEQYEVQGLGSQTASSRNLDPERITAVRVGSVTNLSNVFTEQDSVQIRTQVFRNEIKDEIFKARGIRCEAQSQAGGSASICNFDLYSNYRNIKGSVIKGFEVESYYDSRILFGSLSYSWMTGKHDGAYNDPWGPNVWARDVPAPKWVATLGVKIPSWDAQVGWTGLFVRKTDRLPGDDYKSDEYWDQRDNESYDVQGLFAKWTPQQPYLKGTEVNLTVDNLFNRDYAPMLSGENVYSQGRNAKVSITRFF
ncbi:TonB-dependent receptor [Pseudomonas fontis]|uniref:TonB-dependent hemoglobin/transferrin/lactoferrin family receptor n=1 Tax=Pseudomonas fontis TaxID=2942633 RepID=A0ABT5NP69_9PSED|nr:TonB-dependent receptor [Pseudomonas fontis]MDD0974411.1 TonB-dependent hemoglobin/transferrin/lactoferrin family receptor [Pseudomonas fontis]MDD0989953.1 TonB-dependent hemoglobin/transferrin/lactoferrin family receptor [Pseudomonas fontis]